MINDESIEFNSSNVFTALALFNQLTVPLFIFPITIPIIISSLISTRRIERFLSQPEIETGFEGVRHMARVLCKSNDSLDDDQKSNNDNDDAGRIDDCDNGVRRKAQINDKLFRQDTIDEEEMDEIKKSDNDESSESKSNLNDANSDDTVILRTKSNSRPRLKKQNQLSESVRVERNRMKSTVIHERHGSIDETKRTSLPSFKVPDNVAVCINNGKFSWDGRGEAKLLDIDNLSIPLGIIIF